MDSMLEQINSMGKVFVDFALSMLIQSSLLIVFLLGLDLMLRKRIRAVFRYWIWMIVLAKLVLPTTLSSPTSPVYWFGDELNHLTIEQSETSGIPGNTLPAVEKPTHQEHLPDSSPIVSVPMDSKPVRTVEVDYATTPTVSARSMSWQGFIFLVWLVVVTLMVLLLVQRTFFVRGLIAQSGEASDEMLHIFEQARGQMHVRRRVALKLSPLVASPSVCGLFRPTILIPERLADQLDSRHLKSILLHELAHVKRGDLWISLLQTLLQIFYVYHPLLWVANAMIRKIRETAVDETVLVAMGERAEEYPRTLLNVSKLTFGRSALSLQLIGVVESKKALTGRIRHITSRPFPKTARLGIVGLLSIIIIAAILLPMARAGKDDTVSTTSTFEGRLEFHKPLDVGISAGTNEYPELVRMEWIRFEKSFANAWNATAHVGWLPVEDASWRIKVELLDEQDQILQHSRDWATIFTTMAGKTNRTVMTYADLNLGSMLDQGRIHATRFRVHLEFLNEQDDCEETIDSETRALEIVVADKENKAPIADAVMVVGRSYVQGTHQRERTVYTTDSDGRCRVKLTNKKLYAIYLSVQKPGFATIRRSWSNSGSSLVGRVPLVNLPSRDVIEMARGITMGGIVQDAEGNPIEGVDVHFQARLDEPIGGINFDRTIYHIVQTDVNGHWRIEEIHPDLSYVSLGLRHADYGSDNRCDRRLTREVLLDLQALKHVETLEKGMILTGRVLDDSKDPITRATVLLSLRSGWPLYALTDASGRFRLVCSGDKSAYRELPRLIVEAPGYMRPYNK